MKSKRAVRILVVDDILENRRSFTDLVLHGLEEKLENLQGARDNSITSSVRLELSEAKDGIEAYDAIIQTITGDLAFDILLLDLIMGGGPQDGDELLKRLLGKWPSISKKLDVFIVSQQSKDCFPAVRLEEATRLWKDSGGYIDSIYGPTNGVDHPEFLDKIWSRIYEHLRNKYIEIYPYTPGFTEDEFIHYERTLPQEIYNEVRAFAPTDCSILILGESGTGKEKLAEYIHKKSNRKGKFIPVNLGELTESIARSELFGHKKGSFTGAAYNHDGFVKAAQYGTLFLDEIGEASPSVQSYLLRFLNNNKYVLMGGTNEIESDCRVIAATDKDLEKMAKYSQFSNPILQRFHLKLRLPTLRENKSIIPIIVDLYKTMPWSDEAISYLGSYDWLDGNIRMLRSVIERTQIRKQGKGIVTRADLDLDIDTQGTFSKIPWPKNDEGEDILEQFLQRAQHIYFINAIGDVSLPSYSKALNEIIKHVINQSSYLIWNSMYTIAFSKIKSAYYDHLDICKVCFDKVKEKWPNARVGRRRAKRG